MSWTPTHRIKWQPPGCPPVEVLVADMDDLLYQDEEWSAEELVAPAWTWDPGRGLLLHGDLPKGEAALHPLGRRR